MHYIGIDISKRDFHVCLNEDEQIFKFENSETGILLFLGFIEGKNYKIDDTLIAMESTGSYHLQLAYLASRAGYIVHVINPLIVKKQNQTNLRRVKTDPRDARLIRFCLMNGAGHPFR